MFLYLGLKSGYLFSFALIDCIEQFQFLLFCPFITAPLAKSNGLKLDFEAKPNSIAGVRDVFVDTRILGVLGVGFQPIRMR